MIRTRLDDGMEEYVSIDGEKHSAGVSTYEGRGMDHNTESVVEVLDGQSPSPCAISEVDRANNHSQEDIASQPGGVCDDGQSAQGEDDSVCLTQDQWHNTSQSNPGGFGDNQACRDSFLGDMGAE